MLALEFVPDDIKHKFPKYNELEFYEKRWKNINFSLKEIFYEILRIVGFSSNNFQSDNTKLSMLVKKNYLEKLDNFKFKKVFYYLGSPLHLITHNMEPNRKNWNIKKNIFIAVRDSWFNWQPSWVFCFIVLHLFSK